MLLLRSHPSQYNPNVPVSFCYGDPVPPPEPIPGPCPWSTSSCLGGNCQAHMVGGSASAAGACLLWSPGYLVPFLQPLSPFPLQGPFPPSPPSVAGKPAHRIELVQPAGGGGNARWFSRLSTSPFFSSLIVTLALCTMLTDSFLETLRH